MKAKLAIREVVLEIGAFTAKDHLWLQRKIEERAYQLWQANGHCQEHALSHWLHAETEVLVEFLTRREKGSPAYPASRKIQPTLPRQASHRTSTIFRNRSIHVCQSNL